jgi:hypothetical protein
MFYNVDSCYLQLMFAVFNTNTLSVVTMKDTPMVASALMFVSVFVHAPTTITANIKHRSS